MNLSPHFTLQELTTTTHTGYNQTPTPAVLECLKKLANEFLEPVREHFGPLIITSGYRCPALNKAIGGVETSAHCYGCAADLHAINGATITEIVDWIKNESNLEFDQVIDEYSGLSRWCHLGTLRPGHESKPRKQSMIYKNGVYTLI
jgi:zinc D-Ala-D-Ala carboxypeptidase